MLLRDNLQPTDFADAEVRVSDWVAVEGKPGWEGKMVEGYRVWECRCSNWWFLRHEWARPGRNSTEIDPWILSGYWPRRQWAAHMTPAPKDYDQ
jgi:hypothetical protein